MDRKNYGTRPSELARMLRLHPATVQAWCRSGKVDAIKVDSGRFGRWLIEDSEADRLMDGGVVNG